MSETPRLSTGPAGEAYRTRADREKHLGQRGLVVWFFGLSGSGKTTLAAALEKQLAEQGVAVTSLDGDKLRTGLNKGLGFTAEDRRENIRRAAETAKLLADSGLVVVAAFITPFAELRDSVRAILGDDVVVVFADSPVDVCASRDVKGLYKAAASGAVSNFTGTAQAFDRPSPDEKVITVATDTGTPAEAAEVLFKQLLPRIRPGSF